MMGYKKGTDPFLFDILPHFRIAAPTQRVLRCIICLVGTTTPSSFHCLPQMMGYKKGTDPFSFDILPYLRITAPASVCFAALFALSAQQLHRPTTASRR
ncbi:MAG: hypothetical protein LBT53_08170 [Puniceicoccales bacterium]|jgi:hypothetical protein|nr:hypothetical protein [Puniceicoccales bacterium]